MEQVAHHHQTELKHGKKKKKKKKEATRSDFATVKFKWPKTMRTTFQSSSGFRSVVKSWCFYWFRSFDCCCERWIIERRIVHHVTIAVARSNGTNDNPESLTQWSIYRSTRPLSLTRSSRVHWKWPRGCVQITTNDVLSAITNSPGRRSWSAQVTEFPLLPFAASTRNCTCLCRL